MSIVENHSIIQGLKSEVKNLLLPRIIKDYEEVEKKIKECFHEIEVSDLEVYEKEAKTLENKEVFLIFKIRGRLLKGKKNAIFLKSPPAEVFAKDIMDVTKIGRLIGVNKDVMIDRVVSMLHSGFLVFFNEVLKILKTEKEKKEKRAIAYQKKKKEREFNRSFNSLNVIN